MLDLVEVPLKKNGIQFLRLDGYGNVIFSGSTNGSYWPNFSGDTQKEREKTLVAFSKDSKIKLMLISLKAGGVGLNLVAASHVFFMDCWYCVMSFVSSSCPFLLKVSCYASRWNPAVEDQAIQRVHRIGQTKNGMPCSINELYSQIHLFLCVCS